MSSQWLKNPIIAWRTTPVKTISQAIFLDSPKIHELLNIEPELIKDFLNVIISETVLFFNLGKNMNSMQINSTIELILSDKISVNMTPDDYKVCFMNAKKGLYGKNYDRLDGQIIFEWITNYFNEKQDLIEAKHIRNISKLKQIEKTTSNEGWTKEMLETLKNTLSVSKKEIEVKKEKKPVEKTLEQKLIQRYFRQFEKLYRKRPVDNCGIRYIKIYDLILNQTEFVTIQLKKYNSLVSNK
jgi:hypothetical protein